MKAVRAVLSGRVQGVCFRAWTQEEAERRGLDGWVRNRADGTVEAVFAGDDVLVDDMLQACRAGPPAARVEHIDTEEAEQPVPPGFHQRRTV